MKKQNVLLTILLLSSVLGMAQDVMYFYKSGHIINEIAVENVDSVIFYPPAPKQITFVDESKGTLITIAELKNLSVLISPSVFLIDSNYYVKGVVTANDESGNIYKTLYIQDETGAIKIPIDKLSLYDIYSVGQTVYLNCKGFYLGNSYYILQFGGIYNGLPGRITLSDDLRIEDVVMPDGEANLSNIPEPKTVVGVIGFTNDDISKLVKITNVSFEVPGLIYGKPESYPERTVVDVNGNKMVLSFSPYSNFATQTTPSGIVNITGILSSYQGQFRFIIRDLDDVEIASSILRENFTQSPNNWIKKNLNGAEEWKYSANNKHVWINGWGTGSEHSNEDWLISPSFDLTNSTNPVLTFSNIRKFEDPEQEPISLKISINYTNDGANATWTTLNAKFDTNSAYYFTDWVNSGEIDLSQFKNSANVRIAFVYKSSSNTYGKACYWRLDNVNVYDK